MLTDVDVCVTVHNWCNNTAFSVHCTKTCKNSLVLLRMGEIIARNMLKWFKLVMKLLSMHLIGCLYYRWHSLKEEKLVSCKRISIVKNFALKEDENKAAGIEVWNVWIMWLLSFNVGEWKRTEQKRTSVEEQMRGKTWNVCTYLWLEMNFAVNEISKKNKRWFCG